jgi:hypothetical protein
MDVTGDYTAQNLSARQRDVITERARRGRHYLVQPGSAGRYAGAAPNKRDIGRTEAAIAALHQLSTRTNRDHRPALKAAACECYEVVSRTLDQFMQDKRSKHKCRRE